MQYRYLYAYLGKRTPERAALLRFPPGVTLEDAGYDWRSGVPPIDSDRPALPERAVERLRGLGVEVAASPEAISEARDRARLQLYSSSFEEDYLGVNARLGGGKCVTVDEYAMHTTVRPATFMSERDLRHMLMDCLLKRGGVRVYGGAAFREGEAPDVLRLRAGSVACYDLAMPLSARAPCRLHGGMCRGYSRRWGGGAAIRICVPRRHLGVRVALPRRLLDELAVATDSGDARMFARAALPVARRVIEALPEEAKRDVRLFDSLAPLVAITVSETCEEHAMLTGALLGCRSLREMERRARDPSWAASRALESLR